MQCNIHNFIWNIKKRLFKKSLNANNEEWIRYHEQKVSWYPTPSKPSSGENVSHKHNRTTGDHRDKSFCIHINYLKYQNTYTLTKRMPSSFFQKVRQEYYFDNQSIETLGISFVFQYQFSKRNGITMDSMSTLSFESIPWIKMNLYVLGVKLTISNWQTIIRLFSLFSILLWQMSCLQWMCRRNKSTLLNCKEQCDMTNERSLQIIPVLTCISLLLTNI